MFIQNADGFLHAIVHIAGVHLPVEIPPDVDRPESLLRIPLVDPLGQRPAEPAALAMPTEFMPQPTKKFLMPGASPTMKALSG